MNKRLTLILALAFVAGIACAAYAEVQNVKVSGDLTVLGISRNLSLNGAKNNNDTSSIASITRLRVDADLTDNVMTTVRLLNERYWDSETDNVNTTSDPNTEIALDLAYVTLKEFLYSPLSLTIGRQELHFGNDMIVGDYDTNNITSSASPFAIQSVAIIRDADLSARKAFDSIRATLNYDPLVVDAVFAKVTNNNTQMIGNDDTNLFGVNANYKVDDNTTAEAYWFQKNRGKKALATSGTGGIKKSDRVDTIGMRAVNTSIENLVLNGELAYQFGKYAPDTTTAAAGSANRKAWALETAATYNMPEVKYTPSVTALYAYFSGDHELDDYTTNSGTYRGWDPMYENQRFGDIANAQFDQTNAHILGGIAIARPADDVILKGEYYAYWWAKAYQDNSTVSTRRGDSLSMSERRFVGQEVDLTATYDYTEDVQFALMGGWFVPGPSIDKETSSVKTKVASEIIGSMKVTF
ncbi:MAG: alginate export family protein [Candidatus Omnitrophota bacterium]